MPSPSSTSSTSATGSRAADGRRSESPKPRRSRRTASRTSVRPVPLRVPHPAVGDAGVHEHDRGGTGRPAAVVGDAGRCLRRGHGSPGRRGGGQSTSQPGALAKGQTLIVPAVPGWRASPVGVALEHPLDLAVDEPVRRRHAQGGRDPLRGHVVREDVRDDAGHTPGRAARRAPAPRPRGPARDPATASRPPRPARPPRRRAGPSPARTRPPGRRPRAGRPSCATPPAGPATRRPAARSAAPARRRDSGEPPVKV